METLVHSLKNLKVVNFGILFIIATGKFEIEIIKPDAIDVCTEVSGSVNVRVCAQVLICIVSVPWITNRFPSDDTG